MSEVIDEAFLKLTKQQCKKEINRLSNILKVYKCNEKEKKFIQNLIDKLEKQLN